MKRILVTGCNGQLGRAINEEYKNDNVTLINTDVAELDITKVDEVLSFVEKERPDVIINCAAHTNVNACETQFDLAFLINAIGPRNLSIAASKIGAKMIHVSTDYVFDGSAIEPYTEFSPVAPLGAYGKTKLAGENFVKQFSAKYFIIRTAWLYGDGKNFVKTMLTLGEERGEVGVVADQIGSPTSAKELAKMIHSGVFSDFARESFTKSVIDFTKVFDALGSNTVSTEWLTKLEKEHNLFPWLNYRIFCRKQ